LNRVLGRKVDAPWRSDTAWHDQLILFRTKMRRCLPKLTSIFHTLKIPRTCIANLINTTERVKADDSSAAYSGHISHATSNVTMVMKAIAELSDINGNIADSLIAMVLSKVQSVDQRMRLECGVGFRQLRKCHRTRPGHCVLTHRNKSTAIRSLVGARKQHRRHLDADALGHLHVKCRTRGGDDRWRCYRTLPIP
jgi:hypothetical protein